MGCSKCDLARIKKLFEEKIAGNKVETLSQPVVEVVNTKPEPAKVNRKKSNTPKIIEDTKEEIQEPKVIKEEIEKPTKEELVKESNEIENQEN